MEERGSVLRIKVSDLAVGGVLRPARSFETGTFAAWLKVGKSLNLECSLLSCKVGEILDSLTLKAFVRTEGYFMCIFSMLSGLSSFVTMMSP